MAQSVLTNTVVAAGGRVVTALLGIIATSMLTSRLGESAFGIYSLIIAYASVLQVVADGGLYLTISRLAGAQPSRLAHYLTQAVWVRTLMWVGVFTLGGIGLFAWQQYRPFLGVFSIASAGFLVQALSQLAMGVYQARGVVWRATLGDSVGRLLQIICIAGTATVLSGATLGVVAFAVGAFSAGVVHYLFLPLAPAPFSRVHINTWKELLRTSWPLGTILILNAIYFRIDTIILAAHRTPAEVGLYSLAYRVIEAGLFFPAMFGGLLLPRLSAALQHSVVEAGKWLREGLHIMIWSLGFAAAALPVLAPAVIALIARDSFTGSVPLLQILTAAFVMMSIGTMLGFTLVAFSRQRALLILAAGLVCFNVVANLIYIPRFGATAAAWITVATEALSLAVAAWLVNQHLKNSLSLLSMGKIVCISLLLALLLVALPSSWHVLVQLAVGAVFYIAISHLCRVIRLRDVRLLMVTPST